MLASSDTFGRFARAQARSSARFARYLLLPPLRVISRLTVEGVRRSRPAIARMLRPFTRQREISSRSRRDNAFSLLVLGRGVIPPCAASTPKMEPACLPSALPMSLSESPRRHLFHNAFLPLAERPRRVRCTIRSSYHSVLRRPTEPTAALFRISRSTRRACHVPRRSRPVESNNVGRTR